MTTSADLEKEKVALSDRSVDSIRFIGSQQIAHGTTVQGTVVGGISGLDYDERTSIWTLISDDRSMYSPARFYTAQLLYDTNSFSSVVLTGRTLLRQSDGTLFPNQFQQPLSGGAVPECEAVRIDPIDQSVWYTFEGERMLNLSPAVHQATASGDYISAISAPNLFGFCQSCNVGSRANLTFEGLTFAADGQSLWVSMESSLLQDGPTSGLSEGAVSRVTQFDRHGNLLRQIGYPISAIPFSPAKDKHAENGVSEILAVNDHLFLIVERAAIQNIDGAYKNHIKIFEMDIRGATDISLIANLGQGLHKVAKKRLVLDLDELRLPRVDNIEGVAWGPKLPNGNDSLVLVSDDNFNSAQVTQLLAFEVERVNE